MKIKKGKLVMCLLLAGIIKVNAQGFTSQFVPGLQFGSTKIKGVAGGDYRIGASLATMEIDGLANKFYYNVNASDFYYRLTSLNHKAKNIRDHIVVKNNGQLFGGRLGYAFGPGDEQRFGISINGSYSETNLVRSFDVTKQVHYGTVGAGLLYYQKIMDNLHIMSKFGYEKIKGKSQAVDGRLIYFEETVAYEFYQRFGVSLQASIYNRKFSTFTYDSNAGAQTGVKANQFVIKLGITKFMD